MSQIKTITTSTGQNKLSFDAFYAYVWLKNLGSADVYVADYAGASAGDVDTATLPAGEAIRIVTKTKDIYIYGATTVEAHAQNFADEPFGWGSSGGGEIELTGINITENGTYTPPSGEAYGRVDVSVITPAVVSSLTVTENGTYNAPTGVDGFSPVTVNVPVGAEIITRSAWDAMTTAQKQAKGLVAIQNSVSGYNRGVLVNGADYVPINAYIPYSAENTVICSAYANNYVSGSLTWGEGEHIIQISNTSTTVSDNAVYLPSYTSGTHGEVDLPNVFTLYAVIKGEANHNNDRLIASGSPNTRNAGFNVQFNNNNGNVSLNNWVTESATNVSALSYFVVSISYSGAQLLMSIYNPVTDEFETLSVEQTDMQNKMYIGQSVPGYYPQQTNVYVKFFGMTDVAETDEVIKANMRSLYNTFLKAGENE
jgi:hypothetical protein